MDVECKGNGRVLIDVEFLRLVDGDWNENNNFYKEVIVIREGEG